MIKQPADLHAQVLTSNSLAGSPVAVSPSEGCACWLNWCCRVLSSSHTAQYSTCRAARGNCVSRASDMMLQAAILCTLSADAENAVRLVVSVTMQEKECTLYSCDNSPRWSSRRWSSCSCVKLEEESEAPARMRGLSCCVPICKL